MNLEVERKAGIQSGSQSRDSKRGNGKHPSLLRGQTGGRRKGSQQLRLQSEHRQVQPGQWGCGSRGVNPGAGAERSASPSSPQAAGCDRGRAVRTGLRAHLRLLPRPAEGPVSGQPSSTPAPGPPFQAGKERGGTGGEEGEGNARSSPAALGGASAGSEARGAARCPVPSRLTCRSSTPGASVRRSPRTSSPSSTPALG